jgi:hypothetical protein
VPQPAEAREAAADEEVRDGGSGCHGGASETRLGEEKKAEEGAGTRCTRTGG